MEPMMGVGSSRTTSEGHMVENQHLAEIQTPVTISQLDDGALISQQNKPLRYRGTDNLSSNDQAQHSYDSEHQIQRQGHSMETRHLPTRYSFLRSENEKLRQDLEKQSRRRLDIKSCLIKNKRAYEQLEKENQALRASLEDCKDHIFRLQPEDHMTDSQIAEKYQDFCISVEDWVDEQFRDARPSILNPRLWELSTSVWNLLKECFTAAVFEIAESFPATSEIMVLYVMQYLFHKNIFGSQVYCTGLQMKDARLLQRVGDAMLTLNSNRGEEAIWQWHAEARRALYVDDDITASRALVLRDTTYLLFDALTAFIHPAEAETFKPNNLDKLTEEAEDLGANIRKCLGCYYFDYEFVHNWPTLDHDIVLPQIRDYSIIDAATGQRVPSSAEFKTDSGGKVGTKLCIIHPALKRKVENGNDITVQKATILVRFDHAIIRRR